MLENKHPQTLSIPGPESQASDTLVGSGLSVNSRQKMDGRVLLKRLATSSTKLVFFDPQYRSCLEHLKYGKVNRQKKRQSLPQMRLPTIKDFLEEIERVLVPSGHLMFWVDKYLLLNETDMFRNNPNLRLVDMVIWDKERIGLGYRTRHRCEFLLIFQKSPLRAKGVWKIHDIPDIWEERIVKRNHVHAKPLGLQKRLIEAITDEGDLVVDPCAGGYSVLTAAFETNRKFVGCDLC